MSGITCAMCDRTFTGTRHAARLERWEPYSTKTQRDLDYGPMVCPACVGRVLEDCLSALGRWAAESRGRPAAHAGGTPATSLTSP
jgi:hypothetical protein